MVRDAQTDQTLPFVTVVVKNTSFTTFSNESGYFELEIPDTQELSLVFLLKGYVTAEIVVHPQENDYVDVQLEAEQAYTTSLEGVEVRGYRKKYKNKDNPAVALVRQVIEHKPLNREVQRASYSSKKMYEKLTVGVTNLPKYATHNFLFKPFQFVFENQDSTSIPGQKIFLIYIDEIWSEGYHRRSPAFEKKIITDRKRISLDPKFINEEGTIAMLQHLYQDIDVYENNITLVTNTFKSPICDAGPTYYKYFIEDTTVKGGNRYVRLTFVPRNASDLLLEGEMLIAIDEMYAVKSMRLKTDKATNINFVKELSVEVEYEKNKEGKYYLDYVENDIQFSIYGSKQRVKGTRYVVFDQYQEHNFLPDSLFKNPSTYQPDSLPRKSDAEYDAIRPLPFNRFERKTFENLDSVKKMKYFKQLIDWSSAFFSGYKNLGLLETGDLHRTFSINPIEGLRLRAGLRTNPILANRYYASAYVAYGFKDQQVKYHAAFIWSFKNQPIYAYPLNYIKLSTQYDLKIPGRVMETSVQDILTDNIQRGQYNKFIYARNIFGEYNIEFGKNFRFTIDGMYLEQEGAGSLHFVQNNGAETDTLHKLISNNLGIQFRWAPGEKFYNDRLQRGSLYNKAPTFIARADFGIPRVVGSQYAYQKLSLEVSKRWYFGSLGFADTRLRSMILWGNLPYPLLHIPRASQSYTFTTNSYNMMNYAEFVADRYAELHVNYRMMGFLFNKIPLLKRLQLREAAGIKVLYGHLSAVNNPELNPNTMRFPVDDHGNSYIHTFQSNIPYVEWNVGIENIFKIIRIDYVRRVSYLNHPGVNRHGIQLSVLVDF